MKINSVDQPLSTQTPARGAASVGELAELDETMQVFVLYMRRWTASVEGREGVWRDAAERYGKAGSQRVIGALEIFLTVVANHATRPLQRHGNSCQCLGQDEAILAALISGAGRQDGPLLRMLSMEFVAPAGFTETVGAAAQLHDALTTSMPFVAAGGDARVLH